MLVRLITSASASVADESGAEVSAGASEAASGAVLTPLRRGLGRRFSLGPGRSDAGLTPGLPRLDWTYYGTLIWGSSPVM